MTTLHRVSGELIILIQQSESEGNLNRIWQRTKTERELRLQTFPHHFTTFLKFSTNQFPARYANKTPFPINGFMYVCTL